MKLNSKGHRLASGCAAESGVLTSGKPGKSKAIATHEIEIQPLAHTLVDNPVAQPR